jgi:glycerate kinase
MPERSSVVVAPDSFKGSLSAPDAAAAIAAGVARGWPGASTHIRPMADGGEGTLDAVLRAAGAAATRGAIDVEGAGGATVRAGYGIVDHAGVTTAVLEAAQVVAITDAAGMSVPVAARSTFGLGRQLRVLLDRGVRHFMIGLGGSSTNDGGAGLLAALDPRLRSCAITIMSDVNNPLTGERGATAIFGPQKGVARERVVAIDGTLARYATIVEHALARRAAGDPGAGAAGGLGYALMLIGGTMRSGAEVVADLIGLDAALEGAAWVVTGEGRSDAQTLLAKGPCVVADRARARGVPVSLLSGAIDASALSELDARFDGCFALPSGPATLEACIRDAATMLADRAEAMTRLFVAGMRVR